MTTRCIIAGMAFALVALGTTPCDGMAQGADAPRPPTRATRVRVSTNIANVRPQGRLAFASADSLVVVDSHGNATRILRANVTAVDTSAGRFRHPWQGLGIGLLAGGAAGMAIGFAQGDDPPGFMSMTASENAVFGGAIFGALGGITGLVVGSLMKTDRWHRTPIDGLTFAVQDSRGARSTVAVSFLLSGRTPNRPAARTH